MVYSGINDSLECAELQQLLMHGQTCYAGRNMAIRLYTHLACVYIPLATDEQMKSDS